jgi:putative DNA primase/helicase
MSKKPINEFDLGDAFPALETTALPTAFLMDEQDLERARMPAPGYSDPETVAPNPLDMPFRCLGYNGDFCYYMTQGWKQVRPVKMAQHTAGELQVLAPLRYWERNFSGTNGISWKSAANTLLRICERIGVYDPFQQRGLGAWLDKGRCVLHLGDRLLVDGQEVNLFDFQSRYTYQAAKKIDHLNIPPLDKHAANRFQKIVDSLNWKKPEHAKLFAGWCVMAIIGGALKHRPHLWLTAKPGAGKTWVMEEILKPVLGDFALPFSANVTEAALRQTMGNNALAILIDEFEGADQAALDRVQNILGFARMAFSETSAPIAKGGQNHQPVIFQARSPFFMSSVGVNFYQHADETRVSVVFLEEPFDRPGLTADQHFDRLKAEVKETLTPEYCAAFRLRVIKMIPIIQQNIDAFELAVGKKLHNRRSGDRLGALLAGAFSLTSDNEITAEFASKWTEGQNWEEQIEVGNSSDERDLLKFIQTFSIETDSRRSRTVAQLLRTCCNSSLFVESEELVDPDVSLLEADGVLRRTGIKLDLKSNDILVAMAHPVIKKMLSPTPWKISYGRTLQRLDKDIRTTTATPFAGSRHRALIIPWAVFFDEK